MKIVKTFVISFLLIFVIMVCQAVADMDVSDAAVLCKRSVVKVHKVPIGSFEAKTNGTAFAISTNDFLTNAHVIGDLPINAGLFRSVYSDADIQGLSIFIEKNNKKYRAQIIWRDPAVDVALLHVDEEVSGIVPLGLGNSENAFLGERVVVCGFLLAFPEQTVASGTITALSQRHGMLSYEKYIQTDANINNGNSGGPLISLKTGKVLAVINSAVNDGDSTGFGIPINIVGSVIAQNPSGTLRRAWFGLKFDVNQATSDGILGMIDLYQKLGFEGIQLALVQKELSSPRQGVLVLDVMQNLDDPYFDPYYPGNEKQALATFSDLMPPAKKAGLERGDIIRKVGDVQIRKPLDLLWALFWTKPYGPTSLTILRANNEGIAKEIELKTIPIVRIPESVRKDSY